MDNESLSAQRTDLAEDRTILANERTFAGWMRTGMAAVGIGLAFNAVFTKVEPTWIAKVIASTFVIVGVLIFYLAERKACSVIERMAAHEIEPIKKFNMKLIASLMSIAAALLLVAIWFLM